MTTLLLLALIALLGFGYYKKGLLAGLSAAALVLLAFGIYTPWVWYVLVAIAVVFGVPAVRRVLVSGILMKIAAGALPKIGETERIALEAGSVWWDGEIFGGNPDWKKLINFKAKKLTKEEQAFLDGPTEKLCKMIDDHQIAQDRDLSPEAWQFIKDNGFLGMIISKKYGGLGFSAIGHSAVITKIASRSVTAAVTVMVPNSLGPGELLHHYGTKEQKERYLPGLAKGIEIPCFALTEPTAGSDATNGKSTGVVQEVEIDGKKTLGLKLNFNKRYITLAPVATVIGLAFHLYDPKGLLGIPAKDDKGYIGITCALLPKGTKGMETGNRHDPGTPFMNGPVRGKDVIVPLDVIIGGKEYAGKGWQMLMAQLATGRGISLPSLSVGAAEFSTRAMSAYANVREQFGLPIAKFEGVRERMARIAGHAYFMDAMRQFTCGAVDAGESPAIVSAISKAYLTEGMRLAINDGMDVFAGSAICRGKNNIFTRPYISIPIGITVEGANILTRSLIVFGQGAIRCHPFVQKEVDAISKRDLKAFDKAFFGHFNHFFCNGLRALWFGLTFAKFAPTPGGVYGRYYQQLTRMSNALALTADVGLFTLQGTLKRKEYLSGRYADAFAWLTLASAALHRAEAEKDAKLKPFVDWSVQYALHQTENALSEIMRNLGVPLVGWKTRMAVFPFGLRHRMPSDELSDKVVDALLDPKVRDRITHNVYVPDFKEEGLGMIEDAYAKALAADSAYKKLKKAQRKGEATDTKSAVKAKAITAAEAKLIDAADKARDVVIQVKDYSKAEFKKLK